MKNNKNLNSPFSKFHHVGIVVKDVEKAVKHFSSLGIGPFVTPRLTASAGIHRGELSTNIPCIRQAQVGGITLELLQPSEGQSLAREFLETRGEGVNHIGFSVKNVDEEAKKLTEKGIQIIFSQKFEEGGGCIYLDTGGVGGILVELFSHPSEF